MSFRPERLNPGSWITVLTACVSGVPGRGTEGVLSSPVAGRGGVALDADITRLHRKEKLSNRRLQLFYSRKVLAPIMFLHF